MTSRKQSSTSYIQTSCLLTGRFCKNVDFYFKLEEAFSISVPKRVPKNISFPPCCTDTAIRDILTKGKLNAKTRITDHLKFMKKFQNVRKKCKRDITIVREDFIKNLKPLRKIIVPHTCFYVNSLRSTARIPNTMSYNGLKHQDPSDIVKALAFLTRPS